MIIHAFKMQLKPGTIDEYRRRHDEIWPELTAAIRNAGIHDYHIFLDEEALSLFAVLNVRDENSRDALPQLPVMRRWWDQMAPLMEVHTDNRPVETPLIPLFHIP